jgi:hypothetical protein
MSLFVLMMACDGGTDSGVDYGNFSGEVSTDRAEGVVDINKGFGFHLDGKAVFYFPSDEEATCATVSEYLRETQVDPHGIWAPGECNLTLVVSAVTSDYDPAGYSWDNADGQGLFHGVVDLTCALGDGDFEWGTRDAGSTDKDYFWTGQEWGGAPNTWDIQMSGDGEDTDYTINVDITDLMGSYPGESTGGQVPLSGTVSGEVRAIRCSDLTGAMVWPN